MLITQKIGLTRIFSGTWKHLLIDLLVCFVAFVVNEYFLIQYLQLPAIVPTILGTALAFFVGFNNSQAYDRWWEARKIWGALVNDSRSLARQVLHYTSEVSTLSAGNLESIRHKFIKRQIGFVYALKENLRGTTDRKYRAFMSSDDVATIEKESNKANAILTLHSKDIAALNQAGVIDGFKLLAINEIIVRLCDGMGQSERIKNTVFPTTYSYYSRFFIWIFIICVTIVTADLVHFWSIFLGTLVGYVFLTIHTIGQALLNPFDTIPTGIPLDQISRTIEINLLESIGEKDIPQPIRNVDKDVVM
ncbi:MAG: bestrophin family ion channel [Chryseolinea sp.]